VTAPPGNPRLLKTDIPAAHQDWKAFESLTLSLTGNFDLNTEATIAAGPLPNIRITLTDTGGGSATVDETKLTPARGRPFFHTIQVPAGRRNVTLLRLQTLRVPLTAFTGVDRTKINAVIVEVDPANGTHVFVDSIKVRKA
jgi:hypothetical protein